tara:strand:+ start:4354 stop:4599 length:246 start_codon:yes stop_codon:yes gene_type:complete
MTELREQIISYIETNQFSMFDFKEDSVFDMFCERYSESAIDRVLYELRTEAGTPKIVLRQLKDWEGLEATKKRLAEFENRI